MEIPSLLGAAVFVLGILFVGIIYPIWIYIALFSQSGLNVVWKLLISVGMFFTWPLGSVFYGLFICRQFLIKLVSIAIVFYLIATIAIVIMGVNFYTEQSKDLIPQLQQELEDMSPAEMSGEHRDHVMHTIGEMQTALEDPSIMKFPKKVVAATSLLALDTLLKNKDSIRFEMRQWLHRYQNPQQPWAEMPSSLSRPVDRGYVETSESYLAPDPIEVVAREVTAAESMTKEEEAKAAIEFELEAALNLYEMDNGQYPTSEQGLRALIEKPNLLPLPKQWLGPYKESYKLMDPWGRPYRYRYPAQKSSKPYDLWSMGPNGQGDGSDVDDIAN